VLYAEDGTVDYSIGDTGGNKNSELLSHTHTFSGNALPNHDHNVYGTNAAGAASGTWTNIGSVNGSAGLTLTFTGMEDVSAGTPAGTNSTEGTTDGVNANMPPYLAVYMWERTA
jgi:hypothetical protein